MLMKLPLLSLLIWLPIMGGCLMLLLQRNANPVRLQQFSLLITLICLALCWPLYQQFDQNTYAMQFREIHDWFTAMGLYYELGVDGIALPLVILTCFTTIVILLATWRSINHKMAQYLSALLMLQGMMVGVFCALNAILFYVFWEVTLLPMYLLIGIWGSQARGYAAMKFFLYTFFGSVLMLAAILYLGAQTGHFSIAGYYSLRLDFIPQVLLFLAFLLGFAIKIPMWPVHTWLPHAHTEAPAGGSVILAAIMLKMGGYGLLRFNMPIVPDACQWFAPMMIILSLLAVVYIGLIAIVQTDMKRLIAYSSISHMGFVTLGCFMVYLIYQHSGDMAAGALGIEGAMMVMLSHGLISAAMFIGVGYLYDRLHTRNISDFGGVVNAMPVFSAFYLLFAMANAGLPGTSGFVGEFMVILGSLKAGLWITVCAATTLILGAVYTLWMYKRVIFGKVGNDNVAVLEDIRGTELIAFVLLAVGVIALGVYPKPLIDIFHTSVSHLLSVSLITKL